MQRWTARFLLLLALVGTILPMTLEATAAPSHLCCRRSAQHHCHSYSLSDPNQAVIGSPGCRQSCCRAVTTSQLANPQPATSTYFNVLTDRRAHEFCADAPDHVSSRSQSTRAPPFTSIA